jgi:hypothetical protein
MSTPEGRSALHREAADAYRDLGRLHGQIAEIDRDDGDTAAANRERSIAARAYAAAAREERERLCRSPRS